MKKLKDALENIYMFYNGEDIRSAIWDHDDYDVINEAIVYGDGGDCAGGPLFTLGQLWPSGIVIACVCLCVCMCVCVRQSSVCPDDNLSPAQATITKIGPEVQNTLVKIPIVFGVHWHWSSRSNWT